MNISKTLIAISVLTFAACAQVSGGLKQPTLPQMLGKSNLVPSAPSLTIASTTQCNAQAQVDYKSFVLFCEGKIPQLPLSFTTTYGAAINQFSCQAYMYTDANNQLIVPTSVPLAGCAGEPTAQPNPAPAPAVVVAPATK